ILSALRLRIAPALLPLFPLIVLPIIVIGHSLSMPPPDPLDALLALVPVWFPLTVQFVSVAVPRIVKMPPPLPPPALFAPFATGTLPARLLVIATLVRVSAPFRLNIPPPEPPRPPIPSPASP